MLWFALALASALAMSASDALSKHFSRKVSDFTNTWVRFHYAAPFMLMVLAAIDIPPLDRTFWLTLAILLPLEITAWLLYLKAIRLSPLGLTIPFLGLTPVLLLVVPRLLLGEKVSLLGGLGVVLVAAGIYLLNASRTVEGWLGPLRAIRSEPGSRLMLSVAAIFSVTATLGKVLILHSSVLFVAAIYFPLLALILAPVAFARPQVRRELMSSPGQGALIGFAFALMALSHYYAIKIAPVAYMVAVKRTSLIFATVWGWLFFQEGHLRERLLGATVIVAGVLLVALAH
ncbi:MAG: EamA family transporter [Deltaproteobacteria bacterium]